MLVEKHHTIKKLETEGRICKNYIVDQNIGRGVAISWIRSVACWVIHDMHLPPRTSSFSPWSFSPPPLTGVTGWCHADARSPW